MTPPPLLLGAVLLFWGWQSELLLLAAGMAAVIELPRWSDVRLDFSDKDFNHLADFSTVLWLGVAIYLFFELSVHGLFTLFKLFPLLLFPLLLGQRFSTAGTIRLDSLFWSLRRSTRRKRLNFIQRDPARLRIDIAYPYVLLCLFSASVASHPAFFAGLTVILIWALWTVRPTRYPLWLWGCVLTLGMGLGYTGQQGLQEMQRQMERWVLTWFEYRMWRPRDPYRQRTAIGDIGELKQSNTIHLRVEADDPLLLREASYSSYLNGVWSASEASRFQGFVFPEDERNWQLVPNFKPAVSRKVAVTLYPYRGKAMLPLPAGTYALTLPSGPDVQGNAYGAVKVTEAPGMLRYTAHYTREAIPLDDEEEAIPLDDEEEHPDLRLPKLKEDAEFFKNFAKKELGLHKKLSPAEVVQKLERFFARNFKYTLRLENRGSSALRDFLEKKRVGHCEYFASSTVLLLRAAGIHARYASGYAVQEYSPLQRAYLVRARHAHSWALAYIDGRWRDIDTTPAEWAANESEAAEKWWRPLYDIGAWLYYQVARLRWAETEEGESDNLFLWLVVPLILLLGWRLMRRKNTVRHTLHDAVAGGETLPGADSPFYRISTELHARYPRPPDEPLDKWLHRLAAGGQIELKALQPLLELHYRYRFDPAGLSRTQFKTLDEGVAAWLRLSHLR